MLACRFVCDALYCFHLVRGCSPFIISSQITNRRSVVRSKVDYESASRRSFAAALIRHRLIAVRRSLVEQVFVFSFIDSYANSKPHHYTDHYTGKRCSLAESGVQQTDVGERVGVGCVASAASCRAALQ